MRTLALVGLLTGCGGDDGGSGPKTEATSSTTTTNTTPTTEPDPTSGDPTIHAIDCTVQAGNALRFDCLIEAAPPGPVTVEWAIGDERHRFTSPADASMHFVRLWGLPPESTAEVTAWADATPESTLATSITSGALPDSFGLAVTVAELGSYGVEHVLFNHGCLDREALVVADTAGVIRWYADAQTIAPEPADAFRGFQVTDEGTVLMVVDRDWVVEQTLAGDILHAQGRPAGDFDDPLHHDATTYGGLRHVLFGEEVTGADGGSYVLDGVHALDDVGLAGTWRSADTFVPTGGGQTGGYWLPDIVGAVDWSHANALDIDANGIGYVSMRYQQAIVAYDADPSSPTFGDVQWTLIGDESRSDLASDLAIVSTGGLTDELTFQEQHHVSATARGTLMVFDNRAVGDSRVLELAVDAAGGVADIVGVWPIDRPCPGQGSAFVLPSGNILVDCAPARTILELDAVTAEPVYSFAPRCTQGAALRPLYRAVPIDLFPND